MLEEMGVDYEIVEYKRDRHFRAPPELEKAHPLGRAPVLEVDGRVLAESGAILEFLADMHPALRPEAGTPEFQDYRFWMHYAEGSLMPPLLVQLIMGQIRDAKVPFFLKPITRSIADNVDAKFTNDQLGRHVHFVDQQLAGHTYFVGNQFTAADIQMVYAVEAVLERSGIGGVDHLAAWHARVASRPAYKRALEKGGPAMPPQ
ncbi:MAG: glutathione S-transferase [Deltaproteobacteria bacterium]|nr:MAG: glutathione S-transferase [Deltaproteobacteria bacterium]